MQPDASNPSRIESNGIVTSVDVVLDDVTAPGFFWPHFVVITDIATES
jgi:hypothetical protein